MVSAGSLAHGSFASSGAHLAIQQSRDDSRRCVRVCKCECKCRGLSTRRYFYRPLALSLISFSYIARARALPTYTSKLGPTHKHNNHNTTHHTRAIALNRAISRTQAISRLAGWLARRVRPKLSLCLGPISIDSRSASGNLRPSVGVGVARTTKRGPVATTTTTPTC